MQKWAADGNSGAMWEGYTQGATTGGVSGSKRKNNATPPRRNANESLDDARRSKKRSISPVPEPAGLGFPEGWTSKTFERTTRAPGSRAGTYKVFHSPVINAKFRSRKSAYVFIEILKEPGINADEEKAFEVFKSRGHKL
mmetsp:Transcript_9857/g.21307  ORF Transcript_9857/g.21307 Transcript_9857/m.21307 type:complete len:140 (+) Transcript_9857:1421-1840(+)